MNKSERLEGFNALPLKQRKAIISMVETDQSLEEIRKDVHVGRTAFYNWRNKDNAFMKGLREYSQHYLGQATAKAVRRVVGFIDNKNPYIAMQASLSVINLGGLGSVDGNNKLQEAQTRKAEAEADIAESKAKQINNTDETVRIVFNDNLKPDKEDNQDNGNQS